MTTDRTQRKGYPSDVTDEEWAFLEPYLTLMDPDAPQRDYELREHFNALRWLVRTGAQWRYIPGDLPPWSAVYQQVRRWLAAGCFEAIIRDMRAILREAVCKKALPTAAILDSRTLRSTPESGARAGYDGHKKTKGSKIHAAIDTLGNLLALMVTEADEQDRAVVGELTAAAQAEVAHNLEIGFADQGYTGEAPAGAVAVNGMHLHVVRLPDAKHGFVLLPRRWMIERSFAWLARFRRLARDCERLPEVLAGLYLVAYAIIMLRQLVTLQAASA